MKVTIQNQLVELLDKDLLGAGGEAQVYRWTDQAVKLYHRIATGLKRQEKVAAQQLRDLRLAKLRQFPQGLPKEVVGPQNLVTDARGTILGFTMHSIQGGEDLLRLAQRRWRHGVMSNAAVTRLFVNIHHVLGEIHARSVIVGDLNDANVMFTGEQPWFIDTDSMQFAGFPCVVAHERYLDPGLYGRDLTQGCAFTERTDWYAFAVLLFSSLLYVHPYGGVHSRYPTLLRRAEAHHSILRADVAYPKGADPYRILPDDLLTWFEEVFDHERRGCFPAHLLAVRWTQCACGLEHARPVCPVCAVQRPQIVREAIQFHGKCRQVILFQTKGRILAAAVQQNLRYLHEQNGEVRREDGSLVPVDAGRPGLRFALAGGATWFGVGRQIARVEKGTVVERSSSGRLGSLPVFDANTSKLFRLQDEWLTDGAGVRFGQVLEGQTWLKVGEGLGFGFYRAGMLTFYFLFRVDRPGLVYVTLPPLEGRLIDADAVFDERHVLFSVSLERNGRVENRMHLLSSDGALKASASGPADGSRMLQTLHGKALLRGRILCATDQGLLALHVDSTNGTIEEGTLFPDTEPFVEAGAVLLPAPDGSVYVVTTRMISQLALM